MHTKLIRQRHRILSVLLGVNPRASLVLLIIFILLLLGCASKKNTAYNRFYHSFTTRYNVYFNGKNAYEEAYNQLIEQRRESYSELIALEPIVYNPSEPKKTSGGPFDAAIMKARKSISLHSIRSKPEREPSSKISAKEKAFMERTEYNPFLHNAWMLLGQSQYHNGDFLEAMATFAYIARIYKTQTELRDAARLWQLRCYIAMGWISEGQRVLELIPEQSPARRLPGLYDQCMAANMLGQKRWKEAIPFLQQAAKAEKHKLQKARIHYLLGQLAQQSGDYLLAVRAYSKVIRSNPPFELDLAARIRKTELQGRDNPRPVATRLERMARQYKYAEVQDQIYLAVGHVYMGLPDTTKALAAYHLAADSSKAKAADYALANLRLGDIYMARKLYTKAQPAYSAALSSLDKLHHDYDRINDLSTKLDALVVHVAALNEQDSLQRLAAMPEKERMAVIDSAIAAAKKAAREAEKRAEREGLLAQQEQNDFLSQQDNRQGNRGSSGMSLQQVPGSTSGEFYFYNPQLITQGKALFTQKWGQRSLEDNWRRRRKDIDFTPNEIESDSKMTDRLSSDASNKDNSSVSPDGADAPSNEAGASDPFEPAYYLRNIPLTPEAMEASNQIVVTALEGMGQVFSDQMELPDEAIHSYEALLNRFPSVSNKVEVLYKLYMLYSQIGQPNQAETYRQRILSEYPKDPLAQALRDPEYLNKLRNIRQYEQKIYQEAYEAYMQGKPEEVRRKHKELQENYPTAELLPQMAFLDALCYVLEGDNEGFKRSLQEVVQLTQKSDVAELAQAMLAQLLNGRKISKGGYKELDWDLRPTATEKVDSILPPFSLHNEPYCTILLYPSGSMDRNAIVFAVSAFDYARFTRYTLDAIPSRRGEYEQIMIRTFPSASVAWYYIKQAYDTDGYMPKLTDRAILFPISESNARLLDEGRSLAEYMNFLQENFQGRDPELLLMRWATVSGRKLGEKTDEKQSRQQSGRIESDSILPTNPLTFDIDRSIKEENNDSIALPAAQPSLSADTVSTNPLPSRDIAKPEPLTYEDTRHLYNSRKEQEKAEKRAAERLKKQKEKERRKELKQRERERKERLKQRKREQRERAKQRKQQLKERQKEQKEREKERKYRLKEKEQAKRKQKS